MLPQATTNATTTICTNRGKTTTLHHIETIPKRQTLFGIVLCYYYNMADIDGKFYTFTQEEDLPSFIAAMNQGN